MKIKDSFPIEIYDDGCHVWLCTPEEAREEAEKTHPGLDYSFEVEGVCISSEGRWHLLYLNSNRSKKLRLQTVAHELVHLTNRLFKYSDIQLDVDNDEPQAYLMSFFIKKLQELKVI